MKKRFTITAMALALLALALIPGRTHAQDDDQPRGTIQGVVYEDVNGDGRCVNTGVEGENPVGNVTIEFVSSDEETVLTLQTADNGIYGLYAAGYSYWQVSAKPGTDWVVTSENPLYAPVYEDTLVQTEVNFCVQKATKARVVLPVSGGANQSGLTAVLSIIGLGFMALGGLLEIRRRATKT